MLTTARTSRIQTNRRRRRFRFDRFGLLGQQLRSLTLQQDPWENFLEVHPISLRLVWSISRAENVNPLVISQSSEHSTCLYVRNCTMQLVSFASIEIKIKNIPNYYISGKSAFFYLTLWAARKISRFVSKARRKKILWFRWKLLLGGFRGPLLRICTQNLKIYLIEMKIGTRGFSWSLITNHHS